MNEELKDLIAAKLDVTEFLDILGLELTDILDKFEDEIAENREVLHDACR
jgi:hypothetical protein